MSTKDSSQWRYRCPEGHTNWESAGSGYICRSCKEHGGEFDTFDELVDMKQEPLRY